MQYYKGTISPLMKSFKYDSHDAPLVSYGGIDAVITSDIRNGNTYHRFVQTTFKHQQHWL